MKLIASLVSSILGDKGDDKERLHTSLTIHKLSYNLMVMLSFALASILLSEQYFGRRINCFSPKNFTEPPDAIQEFCWQHGTFEKENCGVFHDLTIFHENWLLQTYVYFFLRAAVFLLPHIIWVKSKRTLVIHYLKSVKEIVQELQRLWKTFSEAADELTVEENRLDQSDPSAHTKANAHFEVCRSAVLSMTEDVIHIIQRQMSTQHHLLYFILVRAVYDFLSIVVFFLLDSSMFIHAHCFDSTDYYCTLPNEEVIRCMVPMMQFHWHASIFAMSTSTVMLLLNILHLAQMLKIICFRDTSKCFLANIPLADNLGNNNWSSRRDRATYKFISVLVLKNISVLHPLKFLQDFVTHLSRTDKLNLEMQPLTVQSAAKGSPDADDTLWRKLMENQ